MVFPTDPLKVKAEIALGADISGDPDLWSWTDISAHVRTADGAKVTVNRGRRNDSGSTSPATATFDLDNTGGRFCTKNPNSPYFPLLQVNTPVRLSVSTDSGSSWSVRFSGYLSKLPTSWRGAAGSDSSVSVTADSILRRLSKEGSRSPMRWTAPNLFSSGVGCIEYWPMEDGEDASEVASYFPTGIPMTKAGSIELGASSPPSGSQATPQSDYAFMLANPPSLTGVVRPYVNTGAWSVLGIFKTDPESAIDQVLIDCDINHGEGSVDPDQIRLQLDGDALAMSVSQEDGTVLGTYPGAIQTIAPNDGNWHAIAIRANQNGANIDFDFRYEGNSYSLTVNSRTLGTIRKVSFPSTSITTAGQLLAVGHLAVYDDNVSPSEIDTYAAAMVSHLTNAGERVDLRLSRLTDESDLIYSIASIPGETAMLERVGSQSNGNILAAIEDAVEADGGILYEPRDVTDDSLEFLSRSAINVHAIGTPALTLTQSDFSVIDQDDDDYYLGTSVTVTGAGSSVTAVREPVENEVSESRNIRFADRLDDYAGWVLYQGTRGDYRYPRIQILLHGATGQIAAWKATDLGDRVLITDPPPGLVDDIDLILEGYQESFAQFSWEVELYCSPASRYRIAKLDDSTYGRMDTAGSRLVNAITTTVTSMDVETTTGAEWSTTASGFDVGVGGERMTVSSIAGSFSDSFTRTTSNGWGTSTSGHAWSTSGGSASDYSVNGTRGIISLNATNAFRSTYISALPVANLDRTFIARIPVLATGAGILVRNLARWDIAANTYLAAGLQVETDQSVTAQMTVVIAGSTTTLASRTVAGLTHGTSTDFRVRFRLDGPRMYMKVWGGATEPTQWTLAAYDTQVTAAGVWGVRTRLNSGNTNTLPVAVQFDTDATLHPQAFTVTRSVNTVVKAHSAGDPLGLFQPNHLGL
jgi:hypothetical protein